MMTGLVYEGLGMIGMMDVGTVAVPTQNNTVNPRGAEYAFTNNVMSQ